jgi:hypothetical protein
MTGVSTTRSAKRCAMFSARVLGLLWLLSAASAGAEVRVLADPAQMLATARRVGFFGQHDYRVEHGPRGPVLRSTAQSSASGLYQDLQIDGRSLRKVRWTWRVDALSWSADLRDLEREDVGAAVFFVFGEPSFLNSDVPTLAYVWSSTPVADGTALASLRFHSLRYIQLRGGGDVKAWRAECRDIAQDYRSAFGEDAPDLRYVAIFNDNDQTGEATSALFGPVEALSPSETSCRGLAQFSWR